MLNIGLSKKYKPGIGRGGCLVSVKYSDGHSGAVHQQRYFFGSGIAAATLLFSSPATSGSAAVFLVEKAAALQRCFLSKFSAATATANKLLPRLFQFTFSHVTVWSLYSPLMAYLKLEVGHAPLVFTLLLLPRYFSLIEHIRRLWRFNRRVLPHVVRFFLSQSWTNTVNCGLVAGQFELIKPISIKPISSSISLTKMQ